MESTQLLREIFLFKDLSHMELIQFNKILRSKRVEKGETVIQEGDRATEMYIVKEGEFTVTKKAITGEDDTLAHLGKGAHFGEIALIDHSPRSASVVSDAHGELLVLDQAEFRRLIDADAKLKIKIYEAFLMTLCGRLRLASENLITAQALSAG